MKISMIGIDHSRANIELREKFALTKSKVTFSLENIKNNYSLDGVVIISTCNRFEIWVSNYIEDNLFKIIRNLFDLEVDEEFFITRTGLGAVEHLFKLTCGLESKILGEDQILSQVKESLFIAREIKVVDRVLEKLFQIAITSGKKVKTSIRLTPIDQSAATRTLELLKKTYNDVSKITCLIIGNGEIGRLTAKVLENAGVKVTITIRQFKKGKSLIPKNCNGILYEDRIEYLKFCDVIISATLSPHNTLVYNDVIKILDNRKRVFIDLAMPRDIDEGIGTIKDCELYNIDMLSENTENKQLKYQLEVVEKILKRYIDEFSDFYYYKDLRWMKLLK